MPKYDQHCLACGKVYEIACEPFVNPPCIACRGATERIFLPGTYEIQGDEIPGGLVVENLGPEPVRVYSKSELRREVEARGLVPSVRHVGVPGSDKSPHTQRFV